MRCENATFAGVGRGGGAVLGVLGSDVVGGVVVAGVVVVGAVV